MRRMTLLMSLVMVFSLITATAAIAGNGENGPDGSRTTEPMMTQTQERDRVQVQEPACQAGDPAPECEPAQTRTQTREHLQVREHDGECLGTDNKCESDQERSQERDRDQARLNDGECVGTDADCEQTREMLRSGAQERIAERLAALADGSGDGEYLRVLVRFMLAHMYGPFSALFT